MHPSDWYDIVTEESSVETTVQKPIVCRCRWIGADVAPKIWGLNVVPSTVIAEGTMLVAICGGTCSIILRG